MSDELALAPLLRAVADIAEPLTDALSGPYRLAAFLAELGWDLRDSGLDKAVQAFGELPAALASLQRAGQTLLDAAGADNEASVVAAVAGLLPALRSAVSTVQSLTGPADPAGLPAAMTSPLFWQGFTEEVVDHLICRYLRQRHPNGFAVLHLLGVIALEPRPDTDPRFTARTHIRWGQLVDLAGDPVRAAQQAFQWGSNGLDMTALLTAVSEAGRAWAVSIEPPDATIDPGEQLGDIVGRFWDPPGPPDRLDGVRLPVLWSHTLLGSGILASELDLIVVPLPAVGERTGPPTGLALLVQLLGDLADSVPLSPQTRLEIKGDLRSAGLISLELRPGQHLQPHFGTATGGALQLSVIQQRPAPTVLLGAAGRSRIELGSSQLALQAHADSASPAELTLTAQAQPLTLVLDPADLDSLLQTLLGNQPRRLDLAPQLRWSSRTGLTLNGQAGLTADLGVTTSLADVLQLTGARLSLAPTADGAAVRLTIGVAIALGPFRTTVQGVGLQLAVQLPTNDPGRNLRDARLHIGFVPPTGVGLALSAPAVAGGGFLSFDSDSGRYSGAFALTLVGLVSVTAIALITTKLPDGSPGFALLIMITADGFTPIPLGLGFTLTGIGGLLALNRTVDPDAVRSGLRSGVLDSILFVKDPVKNANRVLATLEQVFPRAPDRLLVGPLAEISWGTPPIVKVRLALLLDLPQPIRAVLLAALSVLLPRSEAAVVELHVDAIGVVDLGRGELALDASLHDSRIAAFTLTGDLALRLNWGSDPSFVLSVGGFHPRFKPPRGIRPLHRLALSLSNSDNPMVRFEAYFAVTSNSLQMGAKVDLRYEIGGFGIAGGGSFDALLQWSPFALDVSLSAWVRVFAGSTTLLAIALTLEITGPRPWHLTGKASISILFFTVTVPVDLSLGGAAAAPEPVETVDVAALIWEQVREPRSWQASLPAGIPPGATLSAADGAANPGVLAHPLSTISVRQHAAPLSTVVTRFGARLPAAGPRSYVLDVTAAAGVTVTPVADLFAPAQYNPLTDDEKITAPSFTPMTAGACMQAASATAAGPSISCDLSVETLDVSSLDQLAVPGAPAAVSPAALSGLAPGTADATWKRTRR